MLRTLALALVLLPGLSLAQRTAALELLALALEGSFTNREQALIDTSVQEAELEIKRIWGKRKDGAWFYVEQARADRKGAPYRQCVYHVQQLTDSTFTLDMLAIKGGEAFVGAYRDPAKIDALAGDRADPLVGCTMIVYRRGSVYQGAMGEGTCPLGNGSAPSMTLELSIRSDRITSSERRYNSAGAPVPSPATATQVFIKRPKY